jgi:hypothetical protein
MTDRRTLLAGLCATLVTPVPVGSTTTVTDDAGRSISVSKKIEHVFAAGPTAIRRLHG